MDEREVEEVHDEVGEVESEETWDKVEDGPVDTEAGEIPMP